MVQNIFYWLLFYVAWFWCLWWGVRDHTFIAVIGGAASIIFQLQLFYVSRRQLFYQDLAVVLCTIFCGALIEFLFLNNALLVYTTDSRSYSFFPPLWVLILYPMFGLTVNHSLKFLSARPWLFALAGAIGAPITYLSCRGFGVVLFPEDIERSVAVIAVVWAGFLFVLSLGNNRIEKMLSISLE